MSIALEPALHEALSGDMTPKFMATLDEEDVPNCVPIISITPYHDGTLIFGEFFMNKSRTNLEGNPNVGIAVINDRLEGWSLKATFAGFETHGERVDTVNAQPMFRYNAYTSVRAAGTLRVEEVSKKFTLGKAALLRASGVARLGARLLRRNTDAACMPARVAEKFARMQAIRAAAFPDRDGYPRAFPLMVCVPAGPSRLVMADPFRKAFGQGLEAGQAMAVSIITTEPIAYQVKGVYAGNRMGLGIVDLDACYSASPPLLGERLDRPAEAAARPSGNGRG